jgi:hypothetical protein
VKAGSFGFAQDRLLDLVRRGGLCSGGRRKGDLPAQSSQNRASTRPPGAVQKASGLIGAIWRNMAREVEMTKPWNMHREPPPEVMFTGKEWLLAKLAGELEILSNLIYLAEREPYRCGHYLKIAKEAIARIQLMAQECRAFNVPSSHAA